MIQTNDRRGYERKLACRVIHGLLRSDHRSCKDLKTKHESVIANQIGRSGTSIGANIYEAKYAQGKKDFISKLEIALKEASETGYWLELLHRTNYIEESLYQSLNEQCASIRVMLVSSCKTVKKNMDEK